MANEALFEPLKIGAIDVPHRVLMAPLTRSRAKQPGNVPHELNATYYAQRAGAGLIFTEATPVSAMATGYAFIPGMYTDEQEAGWKQIVDSVHAEGGRIFMQLWHSGRISHTDLLPDGAAPIAPSAIRAEAQTYISAESGQVDVSEPRALETDEIPGVIAEWRAAAERAKAAGFDGVEIHGANGYLLDQFTRDGTNQRTDAYGGSLENRLRFPLEVAQAVCEVFGADRVGYRISPRGTFNDMSDSDPMATFGALATELSKLGLAYIHVVESVFGSPREEDSAETIRAAFDGVYIANGSYDGATGAARIASGQADAVAYGSYYISNPDLPQRLAADAPLAPPDPNTFYGGGAEGYTDYPTLDAAAT